MYIAEISSAQQWYFYCLCLVCEFHKILWNDFVLLNSTRRNDEIKNLYSMELQKQLYLRTWQKCVGFEQRWRKNQDCHTVVFDWKLEPCPSRFKSSENVPKTLYHLYLSIKPGLHVTGTVWDKISLRLPFRPLTLIPLLGNIYEDDVGLCTKISRKRFACFTIRLRIVRICVSAIYRT